jgi:hypothetical protein
MTCHLVCIYDTLFNVYDPTIETGLTEKLLILGTHVTFSLEKENRFGEKDKTIISISSLGKIVTINDFLWYSCDMEFVSVSSIGTALNRFILVCL